MLKRKINNSKRLCQSQRLPQKKYDHIKGQIFIHTQMSTFHRWIYSTWIHCCITITINISQIPQIALAERAMPCDRKPLTKVSQICILCSLQVPYWYTQVIKPCGFNLSLQILASYCTVLKRVKKSSAGNLRGSQQTHKSQEKQVEKLCTRSSHTNVGFRA